MLDFPGTCTRLLTAQQLHGREGTLGPAEGRCGFSRFPVAVTRSFQHPCLVRVKKRACPHPLPPTQWDPGGLKPYCLLSGTDHSVLPGARGPPTCVWGL